MVKALEFGNDCLQTIVVNLASNVLVPRSSREIRVTRVDSTTSYVDANMSLASVVFYHEICMMPSPEHSEKRSVAKRFSKMSRFYPRYIKNKKEGGMSTRTECLLVRH